jgi:hypothetical protein
MSFSLDGGVFKYFDWFGIPVKYLGLDLQLLGYYTEFIGSYRRFGTIYLSHLQGTSNPRNINAA